MIQIFVERSFLAKKTQKWTKYDVLLTQNIQKAKFPPKREKLEEKPEKVHGSKMVWKAKTDEKQLKNPRILLILITLTLAKAVKTAETSC